MIGSDRKALSRWLYGVTGLILGGAALVVSLRGVAWETLTAVMRDVRWPWFGLAVVCSVLVACLKAVRWHRLLAPNLPDLRWPLTLATLILAQTLNLAVPIRGLGETLRVGMLSRKTGGHVLQIGGTLILEKALDTLSLALLGVVLAPMLMAMVESAWVSRLLILTAVIGIGLFLVVRFHRATLGWLKRWPRLSRWLDRLLSGLDALRSQSRGWEIAGWTAAVRAVSVVSSFLGLRAVRVGVPLRGLVALDIFLNLSFLLPSPPGLIGVVQYLCILVLGFFGVARAQALVAGMLLNVIIVAPVLLLAAPAWLHVTMRAPAPAVTGEDDRA